MHLQRLSGYAVQRTVEVMLCAQAQCLRCACSLLPPCLALSGKYYKDGHEYKYDNGKYSKYDKYDDKYEVRVLVMSPGLDLDS